MSAAVPGRVLDILADDTDHRRRHEATDLQTYIGPSLANMPPDDGAPHSANTPEADRATELVKPWEVHDWLTMDAEPMLDCGWLIRGLWPADAYGIIAAESKAGKTWLALDLAVSAVCGVPFLGQFEAEEPGPVLYYAGEGGERNIRRRLRAILDAKGIAWDDPRLSGLHIVTKPPRLGDSRHIDEMKANARAIRPRLIVLDPLYLSLSANMASLNEVGAELRELQQVSEDIGAALVVVHHWNKTGTGTGSGRMSGAGAEQWGRVLWSVSVGSRDTDPDHELSSVVGLDVELIGGELAGLSYSVRRTVWSDDPDDLSSPMHYEVTASPLAASSAGAKGKTPEGLSARSGPGRCLAILKAEPSRWFTVDDVQDRTAAEAAADPSVRPLKRDTVGKALAKLHAEVLTDRAGSAGVGGFEYRARGADATD
jgi:hypothetical protein